MLWHSRVRSGFLGDQHNSGTDPLWPGLASPCVRLYKWRTLQVIPGSIQTNPRFYSKKRNFLGNCTPHLIVFGESFVLYIFLLYLQQKKCGTKKLIPLMTKNFFCKHNHCGLLCLAGCTTSCPRGHCAMLFTSRIVRRYWNGSLDGSTKPNFVCTCTRVQQDFTPMVSTACQKIDDLVQDLML